MSLALAWFLQLLISIVLLWGIGGGIAAFLASPSFSKDTALLAPLLGFAGIAAFSSYLSALGLPVQQFAWALLLLGIIGLVAARHQVWSSARHHWPVLAICAVAYVFILSVLMRLGYLTTVGGTIDALSYATRSEYLQRAGLVGPVNTPGYPFYGWVADHINRLRLGDVYFVAVLGQLARLRSYQLLTVVSGLFLAITPATVYLLARRTLALAWIPALGAAAFTVISNLLIWVVYDNFLSQSVAMGMFVILLVVGTRMVETRNWRDVATFALLFSGMLSVYPTFAVPAGLIVALWGAVVLGQELVRPGPLRGLSRQKVTVAAGFLGWGALALIMTGAANGVAVAWSARELDFVGTLLQPEAFKVVGAGNIFVFVPAYVMAGMAAHPLIAYNLPGFRLPIEVAWGGTIVALAWVGFGWQRLSPVARRRAGLAILVLVAMGLQQRFLINQGKGFAYGYFKLATLLLLVLLPLFAQGVYALLKVRYLGYVTAVLLVAIIGVNIRNSLTVLDHAYRDLVFVDKNLIEAEQQLRQVPADEWIWLDVQPGLPENWLGYLLKDHPIRFHEPIRVWGWVVQNPPAPEPAYHYALVQRMVDPPRKPTAEEEVWFDRTRSEVTWSNATFDLIKTK